MDQSQVASAPAKQGAAALAIALFVLLGIGVVFAGACGAHEGSDAALAQKAVAPPAPSDVDRMVTFLVAAGDKWRAVEERCFAAERCGSVEATPHNSAVGDERQVGPCFDQRIPQCEAALQALRSLGPTPVLSNEWASILRAKVIPLEQARLAKELLDAQAKTPLVRRRSEPYGDLADWGRAHDAHYREQVDKLSQERTERTDDYDAMSRWLHERGACFEGVNCNVRKVIGGGTTLNQRYWPGAR